MPPLYRPPQFAAASWGASRRSVLAGLAALPWCSAARAAEPMRAVASFSILADMIRQVGEGRVEVHALAGPNQELHGYEPRPSDLKAVARAALMVVNGLGLEGWADRVAKSAGFRGVTVVASNGVAALRAGHGNGAFDPHAWQNVANAKIYVGNIAGGLAKADPDNAAAYAAAATRYLARLDALDAEIRAMLAPIPRERRRAVTSHDAFAYFADAYGVDMLAVAGTWSDSEPSARELTALIAQVKRQRVRALFLENAGNGTAVRALAGEVGVAIGGRLYADALSGPGGPASSYVAMMRHNARVVADALKGE